MNKKGNSIIFMLIATVVNLLLLCVFFIAGFIIVALLQSKFPQLQDAATAMIMIVFAVSIFGSFFIYSRLVKWATARFDLENKMDPLFISKNNRRKLED